MTDVPSPLRAQTQWFHLFKAMVDHGEVARIGPHAFTVYAVIKAHANYHSGIAYPGIELIAEKSGVSPAQVKRALGVLQAAGLITKTRNGRSNHYTLREKIQVTEADLLHTVATWDYVPSRTQHAVSELKKAMLSGDFAGTQILNIERPNIQINLAGGNSQIEDTRSINLDQLDPSIAKTLRKHLNRSQ